MDDPSQYAIPRGLLRETLHLVLDHIFHRALSLLCHTPNFINGLLRSPQGAVHQGVTRRALSAHKRWVK